MRATINTKSGQAEIAADEKGVVPGVVRVKLGPFFSVFLTPAEARELGNAAVSAAGAAEAAKEAEGAGQ